MYPRTIPAALPLPPSDTLRRFHVQEPKDTRFRACARLLQSVWREKHQLPLGSYTAAGGEFIPLGSRLAPTPARAGFNYLTPDIARLVRRELAWRERGALIDEERAWTNLLSSSALVFNLLGPMKMDPTLARHVLEAVLPIHIRSIDGLWFETSPGRGSTDYIGDGTALDALVGYTDHLGRAGMIGIEVKYAEGTVSSAPAPTEQTMEIARTSGLFADPDEPALQTSRLRQLLAEHTLCHAIVHKHQHFEVGHFLLITPLNNSEIAAMTADYQVQLAEEHAGILPFVPVSLETAIAAIYDAGASNQEAGRALARSLDERYADFSPVFDAIDEWAPHGAHTDV